MIGKLLRQGKGILSILLPLSFIAPLLLRAYLAPLYWTAGMNKLNSFDDTVAWFGNPDWGLGLPFPALNAVMAISAEVGGSVLLVLGLATRLATIPLIFTMFVAAFTVHLKNGWQVIHDPLSAFPVGHIAEVTERLTKAKEILKEHGNYSWLTEHGNLVLSNNGVEFIVAYTVMLLSLFFMGGGKYVSLDYWVSRYYGIEGCCHKKHD